MFQWLVLGPEAQFQVKCGTREETCEQNYKETLCPRRSSTLLTGISGLPQSKLGVPYRL